MYKITLNYSVGTIRSLRSLRPFIYKLCRVLRIFNLNSTKKMASFILKQRSFSHAGVAACYHPIMRRFFSTTATVADSPSLAQRIRELPKDLPGTNIKKHVSQVLFTLSLSLFLSQFSLQACMNNETRQPVNLKLFGG